MPALNQLIFLEKDARDFGFDWDDAHSAIDWTISECEEVRDAIANKSSTNHIQEEVGDLIQMTISLCLFLGFDVDETLEKTVQKFKKRLDALKEITAEKELQSLKGQPTEFMLDLWQQAKKRTEA